MDEIYRDLTQAQHRAVSHVQGPLLVLAGPGSGKTRVITHRIAHLLGEGIRPWQIAALTFTNKAADEMRKRVDRFAPGEAVWMGTFHRFCAQLLRRYASMVGLAENFSIYDSGDAKRAIKRAIAAADVSTSYASPDQIAAAISNAKNRLITADMMQGRPLHSSDAVASRVYPIYQRQLLTANAVDFDDLLLHVAILLRENPELRGELDARFRYIMVDEYQDTNLAQYAIVRGLSIDHPNLAVTGDPDQSIYGWRGADINNILDFEKDYPAVTTVRLEQNYRSTPNILRVADHLIRHNRRRKQKRLLTDRPEGDSVVLRVYADGHQEADQIADEMVASIESGQRRPRDFAVFCRVNALTRSLEHALRGRRLSYKVVNGLEFYQRKEVKDLLAYLLLVNNPRDDIAFARIINTPPRGIGVKTLERLRVYADREGICLLDAAREAAKIETLSKRSATAVSRFVAIHEAVAARATAPLEELIRGAVEETGYEAHLRKAAEEQGDQDPLANVGELISAAVEFDRRHPEQASLETFLEEVALVSDTDALDAGDDAVTLMTLHAAKGLEFPCVYIIAVEDEILPHKRSRDEESGLEEERRLMFVGVTRAQERLQLSYSKRRAVRGYEFPAVPSPFLNEVPHEELKVVSAPLRHDIFDGGDSFDGSDDLFEADIRQDDYPASWDLDEDLGADSVREQAEVCQLPAAERPAPQVAGKPKPRVTAGLTTAAQLMSEGAVSLQAYREGSRVRHPEYGDGEIVSVSGRGPKRTASVQFDDELIQFRLAFAKLELV